MVADAATKRPVQSLPIFAGFSLKEWSGLPFGRRRGGRRGGTNFYLRQQVYMLELSSSPTSFGSCDNEQISGLVTKNEFRVL